MDVKERCTCRELMMLAHTLSLHKTTLLYNAYLSTKLPRHQVNINMFLKENDQRVKQFTKRSLLVTKYIY